MRFSPTSIISTIRMKQRNTQNGSKYTHHKSQTMNFWACWSKPLFPKRSGEMIDGRKKCIRQLGYELQNSHVFEMCSNFSVFSADWHSPWRGREICCCICERTLKGLQAHFMIVEKRTKVYSYLKDIAFTPVQRDATF